MQIVRSQLRGFRRNCYTLRALEELVNYSNDNDIDDVLREINDIVIEWNIFAERHGVRNETSVEPFVHESCIRFK